MNWAAIGSWVVGAVAVYLWTYVWPTPIGATIPAFALTFVLYLLLAWRERSKHPKLESRHLTDVAAEPAPNA